MQFSVGSALYTVCSLDAAETVGSALYMVCNFPCWNHWIFPVNMPDLIQKRFGYSQILPLQPACSQNRTGSYMPGLTSCIWLDSVLPKKAWTSDLCKTGLDPIWMVWSRFGQTDLAWKQAGMLESLGWVLAECNWPTIWMHSSTDGLDDMVQNQPGSSFVVVDCVGSWANGSSLEASRCTRILKPTSGQCFQADLDWMWIGSGMLTGYAVHSMQFRLCWNCWIYMHMICYFQGTIHSHAQCC